MFKGVYRYNTIRFVSFYQQDSDLLGDEGYPTVELWKVVTEYSANQSMCLLIWEILTPKRAILTKTIIHLYL